MRIGLSTHLFHDERLSRDHLRAIAAHGFEAIELFATRTHFDYHDPAAVSALAAWLDETGLVLHSVHAPIVEGLSGGVWGPALSTATSDPARRQRTIREIDAALALRERIPFSFLVAHLGVPDVPPSAPDDNQREAARRSVQEMHALAEARGVTLALEVLPNRLSSVAALRRLVDDELELGDVGLCLDTGHAHMTDDVVDAIEEASGHIVTTHLHDNDGRSDTHLVPFDGTIPWEATLFALQKVGYDGVYVFELARTAPPEEILARARHVRRRFEEILAS